MQKYRNFGINDFEKNNNIKIYHAGTKKNNSGKIVTNGGRVLNIMEKLIQSK